MAVMELRDANAVEQFLAGNTTVLLFVGHRRDRPADAVMASLCALGPAGKVARTEPDGGAADRRARQFMTRIPHTDRACLVLIQGATVLDVLRSTDVDAHGARWATAHFAERFLTRLADG
ncbi:MULTISPECIES: hypothetical protein [unclassified Streptomyces]|uniref:hypothetical protein n=1 Tax=unclassified Streptomyces TaxID=2593676 RepID=UPI0038119926